jgi:Calcineurin-like phosphoesterase
MSDRFDYLDEGEREWLRAVRRRSAARRARLLAAVMLVVVLGLTLLASGGSREARLPVPVPAGPTAEQRAIEDGQRALAAWGRFAVTNDLRHVRGHFWATGPQYQDLLRLAKLRAGQRPLGPPAYRFVLSRALVLAPSSDQRILQGRVQVSRPGERTQSYRWNVWMRRDTSVGDRWRLWTVEATARAPARSPSEPVVVAAAGDIAPRGTGWGHRATSDRVLAIDPTVVLALGDNQYPSGTLSDFRRYYGSTWGRFRTRTRPSPGNHDYETAGAAGYFAYFGKLAKPEGRSYYSFDLGGWHLISLDSNIDLQAGSRQDRWLRADLASTTKRCILAYWHHPRFTSGAHQGDNRWVGPFWNRLYTARADVVLSSHEHNYERFARQNPAGRATPQGIRQFVVGTGGADLLGFHAPKPNSQVRSSTTWGVLVLLLHQRSYRWRFVSEDGQVVDRGGPVPCH